MPDQMHYWKFKADYRKHGNKWSHRQSDALLVSTPIPVKYTNNGLHSFVFNPTR